MPDARQVQGARLESVWAGITGRMVHEIRNPLNAMRMQVAVIRGKLASSDPARLQVVNEQLDRLEEEVLRLNKLATAVLDYSRPSADETEFTEVPPLVYETAESLRPELAEMGIRLVVEEMNPGAELLVVMGPSKLRRVLRNLLENAKDTMPGGGTVTIRFGERFGRRLTIQVSDTGPFVSEEQLPQLFEPCFSTQTSGGSLGLVIARQITEAACGFVNAQPSEDGGVCLEVVLPLADLGLAATSAEIGNDRRAL